MSDGISDGYKYYDSGNLMADKRGEAVTTTTKPMNKREPISNERVEGVIVFHSGQAIQGQQLCNSEMEEYHEERAELGRELLTAREELAEATAALNRVLADFKRVTAERLADANALDAAQREIDEDAKATAESQEIIGKYMADAESAQREIARLKTGWMEMLRRSVGVSEDKAEYEMLAWIERAAIEGQG